MSTTQSFNYALRREQERQLQFKIEMDRLNLCSMKVQQSINQLYRQTRELEQEKRSLERMQAVSSEARQRIEGIKNQLQTCRQELSQQQSQLQGQMDALFQLQTDACQEMDMLQGSMEEAREALTEAERISAALTAHAHNLTTADVQTKFIMENQELLDQRVRNLEQELRFVTQKAELQPAAMITLSAMRQNGYTLREVISEQGLISYFEQAETGHQIAVKLGQPQRTGENTRNWELIAETFQMEDETCLFEIEDFEVAVEEEGIGRIERGKIKIYPKDEKSRDPEKRGLLPPPHREKWKRDKKVSQRAPKAMER